MSQFLRTNSFCFNVVLATVFAFLCFGKNVSGQNTATYTVNSTTSAITSGVAPIGSSATYNQTFNTTKQITNNNSATLTLSGYAGKKITKFTLNMRSNASGGTGNLDVKIGTTSIWTIATSAFNNANWNGAYSTSYVDINRSISHTVQAGEDIIIIIGATVNSLYIDHYSITYDEINAPPTLANQSFIGTVDTPFSQTPTNAGGTATSWAVISGALPTGLTLNTSTGEISGTPTSIGTSVVDVQATNGHGNSIATYSFAINNVPCINIENFTGIPTEWTQTSIIYTSNEAVFGANNGDLTTISVSYPTTLIFDLRRTNNTSTKTLYIEVSTTSQTSGFSTVATYDHSNTTSNGTTNISVDLSAYSSLSTVYIRFRKASSTTSPWYLKNVKVNCGGATCTPALILTEIRPNQAPTNSKVQVEVNDVTLISQVKLSGNTLAFSVINPTTIQLEIPNTTLSGSTTFTLEEIPTCETNIPFVVTEYSGACSNLPNTYNDLFISEVYDSDALNQWYMELYNPTPNSIILDNVYQIKRSGDKGSNPSYSRTINLTGTVQPYSVFTLFLGDATPITCSGITFDFTEIGGGINEKDQIDLFKNGVRVDISEAPNQTGYTLKRKVLAGQTVPTTSYNTTQWDINTSESCSDLGQFNANITEIDIISPLDLTACDISMNATSSTSGATYKWFFNDVTLMTNWNEVSSSNLPDVTLSGQTSDHLAISGNTETLDNYQFYCEITNGTCSRVSSTAVFLLDVSCNNPLPITLTSFSASCDESSNSIIQWTTATETNNDSFIIEKTDDGIIWNTVVQVKGKENCSSSSNYVITDRNSTNQAVYYRLTQVDLNGKTQSFNPISLICTQKEHSFIVFPNPVNHFATVSLNGYDFQNATLKLFAPNGKLLQHITIAESGNAVMLELDLQDFAQGIYLLQWTDGTGKTEMKKLMIK